LLILFIFIISIFANEKINQPDGKENNENNLIKELQNNLIGYWDFDDITNNIVIDMSGNGNNGTIFGAITYEGIHGSALKFDGIDDYVDVGNDSSLKCDLPLSISCWINLQEIDGTTGVIFQNDKWDYPHGYYGFRLRYKAEDGRLKIAYGDGGLGGPQDRRGKTGSTIISPNVWYHVAGIIRGPADIDIYINGSNDGGYYSDGYGGDISYSESSGYISQDGWSKGFFNGIIDEVRIYNRSLSETEIKQLYEGQIMINQSNYQRGFQIRNTINGNWSGAQSFKSTNTTMNTIRIPIRKFGTLEFNLTICLRAGSINGQLLDTLNYIPSAIPNSWTWLVLNFHEISIISETDYFIPITIFQDRRLAVLEALVSYLKDNFKLKYSEVARLIDRDQRTVWTVYRRASLK